MRALLAIPLVVLAFPAGASAASVQLLDCTPALDARDRSATFEARMRAGHATARMQLRFTLQAREEAHRWRRVEAPGLGVWLSAAPGVRRYSYAKTVQNLPAPAAYRMVVRFRWLGVGGAVLRRAAATSPVCRQPDMRPDLQPFAIEVQPGPDAATRRYVVRLRNGGRTGAGPFAVALQVGDRALDPVTVPGLAAGTRRPVAFVAPACAAGTPLTATVDPDEAVDERDELDDVLQTLCPL